MYTLKLKLSSWLIKECFMYHRFYVKYQIECESNYKIEISPFFVSPV